MLLAVRPRRWSPHCVCVSLRVCVRVVQDSTRAQGTLTLTLALTLVKDSNGHKVLERSRLEAIRQRLQQKYWGSQGLNGGVRRLVVDRYIAARPPWEHDTLAPQEPPQLQVEMEIEIKLSPAP